MNINKILIISIIFQAIGTILLLDGNTLEFFAINILAIALLIYNYHWKLEFFYSIYMISIIFIVVNAISYNLGFNIINQQFIFNDLIISTNMVIWLQIMRKVKIKTFNKLAFIINITNLVFMGFVLLTLILDVKYLFYPYLLHTDKLVVIGLFVLMFEPIVLVYELHKLHINMEFLKENKYNLVNNMLKYKYDKIISKKVY